MLRVVHGNRTESLLAALLGALPAQLDPFEPRTIVVGSHLVARWISREVAFARGIAAGLDLVTWDRFVEQTWRDDAAGLVALDRDQLAASIAAVLADEGALDRLPPVRAYLAAAPSPGDRAGPRRVQLAHRVAELAWQYAITRPDWLPAFVAGRVPAELDGDATARWQAALLHETFERLARAQPDKRFAITPQLPWARRRAELAPPALAAPLSVFGVSFLQRAQLEALTDLAQTNDVTVYLLDPCRELWDDVAARKQSADPLPLVLWGRPVRDTIAALVERSGGDVDDAFTDTGGASARELLLADVLSRRVPSTRAAQPGAAVLACPNPRRELEIIAGEIRRRLDADPALRAHEIGVWIAGGEPEVYLAQAMAAFEGVRVPCHLIDAPIDDRGRIGEAVLALLELPTSQMRRRDLLRVMTHPAVLAGYPHVDAEDWVAWTDKLGIAHGADGGAYAGTYLEAHRGHFHWDQGVRRLALGAFMVGDRGPVQIVDLDRRGKPAGLHLGPDHGRMLVAPEEIRPEHQASAASFALLVRSLCADADWLVGHEATLAAWAEIFVGLVDCYLTPRNEEATRDLERVRAMLAGLARRDLAARPIGFREAREYAVHVIETARANRGEPLAAGVMIAPLAAMRAVPFRVAFVAGLAEGAFPAGEQPSPLDVRRGPRAGDVSPRDRDRHAFLEVLLGARDALYLSYVAIEPKSGSPLAPSSVVLELADALAPYLGASSSREALAAMTVKHPLHRFSSETGVGPAIVRERWAAGVRDAIRAHLRAHGHPVPDEEGMLRLLADPAQSALRAALALFDPPPAGPRAVAPRPLALTSLRLFLESPIQAWAKAVLDLDELDDDTVAEESDEPFQLDQMRRALLLREVLAAWLREPASEVPAHYDAEVQALQLRGQYPVGVFAEAARAKDLAMLERWKAALEEHANSGASRIAFGRASSKLAELRPALELALSGGRVVRLTGQTEILLGAGQRTSVIPTLREYSKSSPYHLRGALDHVVLAAAGLADTGHRHIVLHPNGASLPIEHKPWEREDAVGFLRTLCTELLDEPHGYLLPLDALRKALGGEFPSRTVFGDPTQGLGYGPIVRRDSLELPRDALAMAQRRLRPLAVRMMGEHGFEVEP